MYANARLFLRKKYVGCNRQFRVTLRQVKRAIPVCLYERLPPLLLLWKMSQYLRQFRKFYFHCSLLNFLRFCMKVDEAHQSKEWVLQAKQANPSLSLLFLDLDVDHLGPVSCFKFCFPRAFGNWIGWRD